MNQKNKSNKRTSVDLSEFAQVIKERYLYLGLKNVLSAGLILFDFQTDKDKFNAIGVASGAIKPKKLTAGEQRFKRIEKAIALIEDLDYESGQGHVEVEWLCKELLKILAEPVVQEDAVEESHGQISGAVHVIKNLSPDGSLRIEFLSEEDRQAAEELTELIHPKTKKPNKGQTA